MAAVIGWLMSIAMIIWPDGFVFGSVTWRPVFLGSILAVLGSSAALSGALLARSSPTSSPSARDRFAWVERPGFLQAGVRVAVASFAIGLFLDLLLFFAWVGSSYATASRRIALGALAQQLLLTGAIFVAVLTVYRIMLDEIRHPSRNRGEPEAG